MRLNLSDCVRRPVEDTVLRNLQLETLRKAVDGLGTQSRDLVELRYGRGLTMEEIGTIYGVSKAAVSKRLKKLHEQLRGSVIGQSPSAVFSGFYYAQSPLPSTPDRS